VVPSSQHVTQGAGNSWKFGPLSAQVKFYSLLEGADWDGASPTAGTGKEPTDPPAGNSSAQRLGSL